MNFITFGCFPIVDKISASRSPRAANWPLALGDREADILSTIGKHPNIVKFFAGAR